MNEKEKQELAQKRAMMKQDSDIADIETLLKEIQEHKKTIAELKDALIESNTQIEYLHEKFKPTGTGNSVIAQNKFLLQKLGDE